MFCVYSTETLRKYPPVAVLQRIVTKPYTVPGTDIRLDVGQLVLVSALSIHKDADIYPDPERYDPSRFDRENVLKRPPCTFLPFGDGPRICIGARFGVVQAKVGLVTLLSKYRFHTTAETQIPIVVDNYSFTLTPTREIHLRVERI